MIKTALVEYSKIYLHLFGQQLMDVFLFLINLEQL